jgi:hypothetical protein
MQALMDKVINSIPWDLTQYSPIKKEDWAMFDKPRRDLPMKWVDHRPFTAQIYCLIDGTKQLGHISGRNPVELPY